MLTTPWLYSSRIISWTEVMEYPVSAVLSTVHCCGRDWYLLFFDLQWSQSRRVLWETRQVIQLISSVSTVAIPEAQWWPFGSWGNLCQGYIEPLGISIADTLVHTGGAWDISPVCWSFLNLSAVLDSLSTPEEQIGKEEKRWSSYYWSLSPEGLFFLLCSLTSMPMSWWMTMACSVQTIATWIVYSGPYQNLQGTSCYLNPYRSPPAQLILSGTGHISWRCICLGTPLNDPWENTLLSHLTGVTSRGWEFLSYSQIPTRIGIPVAWLHYHLVSYCGP